MLPDYMRPIPGDGTGNDMRWDSLTLEVELYLRTGNYRLLRDARVRQGRFVELEGSLRIAVAYYCMAFYSDLNGFDSIERLLYYQQDNFRGWKSTASVDAGIVNKIFDLCCRCGISEKELLTICRKAFIPGIYQCHLFTVKECRELLLMSRDGRIGDINSRIRQAESRFLSQFACQRQAAI